VPPNTVTAMPRFSFIIRRSFLWALVALVPLSTRPARGCSCADGHYEPSCPAILSTTTADQCSCPRAPASGKQTGRACCSSQFTFPSHTNPRVPVGKCCCNPDAHPTATPAEPVKFAPSWDWEALGPAALDGSGVPTFGETVSRNAYGDTGPPVLDRIVCLHRLLI
jgi:hypothetical protein